MLGLVTDLETEWQLIRGYLPDGWESLAREHGALRRARGIQGPEQLLRVILLHAAGGLSLRQTVARAEALGLGTLSDVALMKRLEKSEAWLAELTRRMLERTRYSRARRGGWSTTRRVRVVDATVVLEPGATGSTWRVHYAISLPSLTCDFFEVTDDKGGETLKRFPIRKGDLVLADRGYAHAEGIAQVVNHGADVVLRVNLTNVPLFDPAGDRIDILERLRSLKGERPKEWEVRLRAAESTLKARLCAVRSSPTAAALAVERARRRNRKKRRSVDPRTLEAAAYVFVLTTAPKSELTTEEVLELYRARWQIELAFKRLKSLLGVGHVPKYKQASARAWIQAKLLTVLLAEQHLEQARAFSPWGFELAS